MHWGKGTQATELELQLQQQHSSNAATVCVTPQPTTASQSIHTNRNDTRRFVSRGLLQASAQPVSSALADLLCKCRAAGAAHGAFKGRERQQRPFNEQQRPANIATAFKRQAAVPAELSTPTTQGEHLRLGPLYLRIRRHCSRLQGPQLHATAALHMSPASPSPLQANNSGPAVAHSALALFAVALLVAAAAARMPPGGLDGHPEAGPNGQRPAFNGTLPPHGNETHAHGHGTKPARNGSMHGDGGHHGGRFLLQHAMGGRPQMGPAGERPSFNGTRPEHPAFNAPSLLAAMTPTATATAPSPH